MPIATAIEKQAPDIDEAEIRRQTEELGVLVEEVIANGGRRGRKIDQLVPPDTVHQYDEQAVLRAAYEKGCLVTECCMCRDRYLANGKWVKPESDDLKWDLRNVKNMSDGFCPPCEAIYRDIWGLHEQ